ncbi:MAG TPA: hypothetical protein VFN67_02240 [Polyangiales bacterium]|nr:hypothetical protein [Polyangiales bacterium]
MNARALRNGARLCSMVALGLLGCTGSDSQSGSQHAGSRYQGPGFPGGGVAGLAQSIAAGPGALDCGDPTQFTFTQGPPKRARSQLICFYEKTDRVMATMEWIVETSSEDSDLIHARLTLNPDFADNTYGASSIGWGNRKGPGGKAMAMPKGMGPMGMGAHTFKDLLESDHAEFKLTDKAGKLVLHFKEDYFSQDKSRPSGYGTLGVSGGDGKLLGGNASDLVAFSTSLERNFNACGLDQFTIDSPATDKLYTPVAGAEAWDYRVVYDVWVRAEAFGAAGFGKATVDFVHASPSKAEGGPSSTVEEGPCPPDWRRYCTVPGGCEIDTCGDQPDDACTPPPDMKERCGDQPDGFCKEGEVPPPPSKEDKPEDGGDAPL